MPWKQGIHQTHKKAKYRMRANEFITETIEPLRKSVSQATTNLTSYSNLDNSNNPYLAYRFGVALPTSPNNDMPSEGPIGSKFTMIDYTDADEQIRKGAEKIIGVSASKGTGRQSKELDSTNKISPTAKIPKNRYGV